MVIEDEQYRFIAVDIGAYGQNNDSRIFKSSSMGRRLYTGNFNIPLPRALPGSEWPLMPYGIVGDEAFQMCPNLLKPYFSSVLHYRKRIFNYRLSQACRYVECAFGMLCAKWRILTTCNQLNPDTVNDVVKACIILHNYVIKKEPLLMQEQDMVHNLQSVITIGQRSTTAHYRNRKGLLQMPPPTL